MAQVSSALPFPYRFDRGAIALVMIDMQRDFLEPGGFGAALGNDVDLLRASTLAMIRAQGAIVGWTATVDRIAAALHD